VYRYRCEQCRTTSPPVRTRPQAEAERDRHRDLAHAGHIPDGERIVRPPARPRPPLATTVKQALATTAVIAAIAIAAWVRLLA
jgi:hypothetical protein